MTSQLNNNISVIGYVKQLLSIFFYIIANVYRNGSREAVNVQCVKVNRNRINNTNNTNDDSIFVCYANKLLSRSLNEERNRNPDQTSDIELVYEFLQKNLYGSQKHYSKYLWLKKYFQEVLHEFISNSAGDDSDDKRFVNEMLVKYMNL